jgi:hypothetical protein
MVNRTISDVFEQLMANQRRLSIPGFSLQESAVARQVVFPPGDCNALQWFEAFRKRFEGALERHDWLPIYRAGHGEYMFATGLREVPKMNSGTLMRHCVSRIYRIVRHQSPFYSGTPEYGYETYKFWKLSRLRKRLREYMKMVSLEGIVCCYFSDRDAYPLWIQSQFLEWLRQGDVFLGRENYGHTYFVYGLLHGTERNHYLAGRKVLFISSDQERRTHELRRRCDDIGVREFRFAAISRSHSMLDVVKRDETYKPDVCFVGGGVGAANVLWQLRGMRCPCVDAGFVLDTLAFPAMKRQRLYCVNDDEWEEAFGPEGPKWAAKFDDRHSQIREVRDGTWKERR